MLYVVVTFAIRLYICSVHSCGTSLHRLSSYLEKDFEGMKPIKNVVHISKDEGSVLSVSVEVQRLYVLKRLPIFSHSSRFSHNFSSSDFDVDFHQVDEGWDGFRARRPHWPSRPQRPWRPRPAARGSGAAPPPWPACCSPAVMAGTPEYLLSKIYVVFNQKYMDQIND